ncbi:toxin-antitoxin system YwqK family antitoxin [Psychroserpens ponticola]|uniref:Toxin-antitoxin system YwqK family antitoxin n=1 Tax=Psychroserpens ponticola TaxID=2932268 RepID=A0ABY7RZB6_9FLAO|nr:toxin-antitoxin system YwqK family antitoxin [Psychroserpens ponticola]WCO02483.1 toxin-antitoxin system YwqK family antitoxin [Psychroserpens ponticola]
MIKQNIMSRLFFMFILTMSSIVLYAQGSVNQLDEDGKRHGVWEKYFDKTDQLRYEGKFDHGKEIDTFNFYTLKNKKSVLSAVKVFNPNNNLASVKFISSRGKLISEGTMNGRLYTGKWTYYQNKSAGVLSAETYNDQGKLDGEKIVYYPNGKTAEIVNYKDGKFEGISKWYSERGTLIKDLLYSNDELHGLAKYYDADGIILAEGEYQHGRKHKIWNYYEGGKLKESKDHTRRSKNPKKQ